ncbi:restriction endonuclease subunit S [Fibrobacter sp.]|uniref:restriction endonuclease subunit S n=1 Tax=Fibrobacter sp. TaxID=35828 RepID=UPI00262A53E9|nr:restriction endonuclease subunit S [Fibrobacter sp.]MDD5943352.1 restriction endonuclease subunit S [Fibrobacter sp.]
MYKRIAISEIGSIVSGATPKTSDATNYGGDIPWLTPADLSGYTNKYIERGARNISKKGYDSCSTQIMPAGSILFSSRAPIGYVAIAANPICTNQGFKSIVPNKNVDSEFLFYQLKFLKNQIADLGRGTTFKEISGKTLGSVEIVLPDLKEQKRIVNKIEELFSELDSAVEILKKTKEQLAVYRQSVLKSAFEREEDGKFLKIKDFANVGTGATPLKTRQDYYNGNIAWVSSGKVNDKKIYTPTTFITEKALEETNCSVYPVHTIVVAMYGEGKTRGQCAELMIDAATNQALAAIVLQDNSVICKDFLLWFLTFNYEELRRKAAGGVQPNLNLNLVKNISVPYYDMDMQMKIVSEIESKLTVCENIEKTVNDALIQADAMRQSILKKAFEGSL